LPERGLRPVRVAFHPTTPIAKYSSPFPSFSFSYLVLGLLLLVHHSSFLGDASRVARALDARRRSNPPASLAVIVCFCASVDRCCVGGFTVWFCPLHRHPFERRHNVFFRSFMRDKPFDALYDCSASYVKDRLTFLART